MTENESLSVIKAWLLRLLKEETPQATGVLENIEDGSFCCLGDWCDVAVKMTDIVQRRVNRYKNSVSYSSNEWQTSSSDLLPVGFMDRMVPPQKRSSKSVVFDEKYALQMKVFIDSQRYYVSPSELNDHGIRKAFIGSILWAIAPLGHTVKNKEAQKIIFDMVPLLDDEISQETIDCVLDLVPQIIEEVEKY